MDYDVAVIGAGPAGSTAARFCALRGMKTLLLDRCAFPRPKTCGGGLTLAALNSIGVPLPERIVLGQARNLQSFFGGQSQYIAHPRPFMVIVDRAGFDYFLAEKAVEAGAVFNEKESLTGLSGENGTFSVRTPKNTYRAHTVIGADGVYSTTARLAGLPSPKNPPALCLTGEVPAGSRGGFSNPAVNAETIAIYYNILPRGFGWVFPGGDKLLLGVGSLSGNYGILREAFGRLASSAGLEQPLTVKGYHVPWLIRCAEPIKGGILLAGDAAGFVDPFTGEGIRYAVISGMLAGETVWNWAKSGLPAKQKSLAGYIIKCRQAFLNDFKYSYLLSRAFFAFPFPMHRLVLGNDQIYSRLLNILEGRSTYRELIKNSAGAILTKRHPQTGEYQ